MVGVIGDKSVGKTTFLALYQEHIIHESEYLINFMNDNAFESVIQIDDQKYFLSFRTFDDLEFTKLKLIDFDLFIICFSLISPSSCYNIENTYVPNIKKYFPNAPYVIYGLKKNLLDKCNSFNESSKPTKNECILSLKAEEMKNKIEARDYFEISYDKCPDEYNKNIEKIFKKTIISSFNLTKKKHNISHCILC